MIVGKEVIDESVLLVYQWYFKRINFTSFTKESNSYNIWNSAFDSLIIKGLSDAYFMDRMRAMKNDSGTEKSK